MKKFEELHAHDQILLILISLQRVVASGHKSVADLIRAEELSAADLWCDHCGEAGLDECAPWRGWPAPPQNLPAAPGDRQPLPESAARLMEQWDRLRGAQQQH
jgi:hypothetical protein